MAININTGFNVHSSQPIDVRNVISKADMLTINENIWPDVYYATCKDDGQLYVFNKTNEKLEDTGKFRLISDGFLTDDNLEIGKEITTTQDIGLLTQGTNIKSTATLKDIIMTMLTGTASTESKTSEDGSITSESKYVDGSTSESYEKDNNNCDITYDETGKITDIDADITNTDSSIKTSTNDDGNKQTTLSSGTTKSDEGTTTINNQIVLTYDSNGNVISSRQYL